ncbi:MAG: hypothetical protein JNL87_00490 [Burkholderiaceae bacterium]|nr:hypothetical protein [Burkholderiaceae bacterium]
MFSMSRSAAAEILAAAERSDAAGLALRIAARREADGSIGYGMGFDDHRERDSALEFAGLQVLIAPPSLPLLQDTVLDYVELAPGRFDFVFAEGGAPAPEPAPGGCGSGGCSRCGG